MQTIRVSALLLFLLGSLVALSCRGDSAAEAEGTASQSGAKTSEASGTEGSAENDLSNFRTLDFQQMPEDFEEAMAIVRASQTWDAHARDRKSGAGDDTDPREALELKMDRDVLEQAYESGSGFLINWQLPEGNFRYMYDWLEGTWVEDDHQVRQAGSLWGIGTCYRYRPSKEAKEALDKGLAFWFEHTIDGPADGTLTMRYPGDDHVDSGTVALVSLSIIEYLMADAPMDEAYRAELNTKLDGYLAFLVWMQHDNGLIAKRYDHKRSRRHPKSSPYYDGESLLAMTKAARQLDRKELVPTIETAARAMAEAYTIDSWAKRTPKGKLDRDSNQTKGFFQWGCMSFVEYYLAEWKDYELYGDVALSLGWWMTHTHATLSRGRNHAYAVEGIISAWRIAQLRGDIPAQTDLLYTLDRSLYKLSGWQIGGPLADTNKYLRKNAPDDPLAQGGVMNARKPSGADVRRDVSHQLRIDVTQHQMHAVTMSLEDVYLPLPK